MYYNSYRRQLMPYPQPVPKKYVGFTIAEADVPVVREWARRQILENEAPEEVQAFLFLVYQGLGDR